MSAESASRPRSPKGEGERLREEILDAAEALLIATGDAEAVSMRSVAGRVGCTPAAIYLHFADKTEMLFEVCRRVFEAFEQEQERAAARAVDVLDELRERGRAYVRFGIQHPEQYRILFMERAAIIPEGFDAEDLIAIGGFQGVVDAVGRAIAAGALRAGDPFTAATQVWTGVHGLTSLLISKPWFPWPEDRDAFVDQVVDAQIRALAP